MGGAGLVVAHAWNEWGIQALVLLSFTLQVALLITAEFRRRVDSVVLRFFVWSAYMLADGTAIYVLGHMSVTSRSPEHQLMAFWAPFLLLHLGGQDNITAYAIEDNRLWLRHLQTLAVQVAAAGYVLYQSSILGSHALLSWSTILMFVVGTAKYGERVWTLRCAGSSPAGRNYRTFQASAASIECQYYLDTIISTEGPWDTEAKLLMAHRMLDVPMDLLKGPLGRDTEVYPFAPSMSGEDLYKVVEMQLSLMHDVFYTKVAVMHSNLYGLCMRILLAVATAAAFLLFHLLIMGDHVKDKGYNRLDVAVTYVLLVGAIVLETMSLLGAIFSSWTCPLLVRWSRDKCGMEDHTLCNLLGRILTSLRRLVRAADWRRRYWSGSMGQHNLLHLGASSKASWISKMARWMGFEDWWNTLAYSWSIPVSEFVDDLLVNQVLKGECASVRSRATGGLEGRARIPSQQELLDGEVGGVEEHVREEGSEGRFDGIREDDEEYDEIYTEEGSEVGQDKDHDLFDSRGRVELKRWGLYKVGLTWSVEERIVVWHIATNVYLSCTKQPKQPKAKAVEALSNYMMFLLAARPYMLSPTASRNSYVEVCYGLTTGGPRYNSAQELASVLLSYGDRLLTNTGSVYTSHREYGFHLDFTTQDHLRLILQTACKLGANLISKEGVELQDAAGTLELFAQVWVEMLCYASQRCSEDSHAKQLSNGGDLITIAALLVKYLKRSHFPTPGTHFNPRRWHRGGPFGSPPPNEKKKDTFFRGPFGSSDSEAQP
ncbi:unnamed protein product [Urochloa humidicola]